MSDQRLPVSVHAYTKASKKLTKYTTAQLYKELLLLDTNRAKNIDKQNPHRLIRAIEIATKLGKVPTLKNTINPHFNILQIGITTPKEVLEERITKRLHKRLRRGMIAEIKQLHTKGLSYKRMIELGLEYKFITLLVTGKLSREEAIEKLTIASFQYAKRQLTWFKRDKRIKWVTFEDTKKTFNLVQNFL